MRNLEPGRAKWIRFRMGILAALLGLGMGGFVASAYRVQVEDGAAWRETAEKQRERRTKVEPRRGRVFDRHGTTLAVSVEVPVASFDVTELLKGIKNPTPELEDRAMHDAAARIGRTLTLDPADLHRKFAAKKKYVFLKRSITREEVDALRSLADATQEGTPLRGIAIDSENKRFYPSRELAGNLLGFVSTDGFGKDGLELALDTELRGKPEELDVLRDRSGRMLASPGAKVIVAGHDVELSLDETIQRLAESELAAAHKTYETFGGSVVVVDPNTGEILAMASTPGFNPNDYSISDVESRRDRAITDRFEPGSVMKVFTIAAAFANGKLSRDEKIYCEHGLFKVGPTTVHDTHQNDWLTPEEILQRSSNIGSLKIGLNLGEASLYSSLRRFGFGEPTGIPLPGEAAGVLRPRARPWVEVETANASFGQGISVTTLQLAMAMSAVANDGKLLEPILVKNIRDAEGNVVRESGVTRVRRDAIPSHVARMLREMLVSVTEKGGTAEEAAIKGYRVAGKTSTAQKVDPATGKYSNEKFTSSFVGFVPAEKPRLVVAVVLDEPSIGHFGGDLAGPVFRRIAGESLRVLGVRETDASERKSTKLSDLSSSLGRTPLDAIKASAYSSIGITDPTTVRIPDLSGLSARDAIKIVTKLGLIPALDGTGRLTKQSLTPGAVVSKGSLIQLLFEPS
ncbi:MAG: transpeptidase family protein [Polyangiaceae bacterium]|nr:transpeptidase family protein [Polyangiaceae bacterium]